MRQFLIRVISTTLLLGLCVAIQLAVNADAASFTVTSSMGTARWLNTSTLLSNGKILVTGGNSSSSILNSAELYDPATGIFSTTGSMTTARYIHTATLLPNGKVLIVGGYGSSGNYLSSAELYDPVSGNFSPTGSMSTGRDYHTATLLPSGKVLIAGGFNNGGSLNTAELYDPATETFTTTGSMTAQRGKHTATSLPNGKVLITGGATGLFPVNSAELYDPTNGTFSATGSMSAVRFYHSATLLPSGKVLIAGGYGSLPALSSAELYDPATAVFSATGGLTAARNDHSATVLPSGKVLIVGGYNGNNAINSSELYDPISSTFSTSGSLSVARFEHAATLLPNGKLLIAGGSNGSAINSPEVYEYAVGSFTPIGSLQNNRQVHKANLLPDGRVLIMGGMTNFQISSAEIYNPVTKLFAPAAANMNTPRDSFTSTLLPNGKILITGGRSDFYATASAELFSPQTDSFSSAGAMSIGRAYHSATLLRNGKILISGGGTGDNGSTVLRSAEIYDPATNTFSATAQMVTERSGHMAVLLHNGKVLIAGGYNSGGRLSSAELYDPDSGTFTATGNLRAVRYSSQATLLPNGKVLITGGDANPSYLNSAELYDPNTGVFTSIASMNYARSQHSATLLSNGKVLIAGGYNSSMAINATELYDPIDGTFVVSGNMASVRSSHSATLLNDGTVLVVAGYGNSQTLYSAELYDTGLGFSDSRRPVVTSIGPFAGDATLIKALGSNFTGDSEGAGGGTNSSATNYPLLQLKRIDNGFTTFIPSKLNASWTSSLFTSSSVYGLPIGHYQATIFADAVPSQSALLRIAPAVLLSPASLNFPATYTIETSAPLAITVNNFGNADMLLNLQFNGADAGMFQFSPGGTCGSVLVPGGNCSINVSFVPTSAGSKNASLTIKTNDPDTPVWNISLTGAGTILTYPLTLLVDGNVSGSVSLSTGGECTGNCSQSLEVSTSVTLTPLVPSGSYMKWSLDCSGTGPCTLNMTGPKSAEATFTSFTPLPMGSTSYYLLGDFAAAVDAPLIGTSYEIPVGNFYSFAETTSTLVQYDITTSISGNGTVSCPPFVEHGLTGSCTVTPAQWHKINEVTGCGGTLNGTTYTTGPITTPCTITAAFNPDYPPVASVTPNSVSFGNQTLGTPAATTVVTVANSGIGNPLWVNGLTISGQTPEVFTVASGGANPCPALPAKLNAGESCTLAVTFNPATAGNKSATLAVASNDPATPTVNVPLSGIGVVQGYSLNVLVNGNGRGTVSSSMSPDLTISYVNPVYYSQSYPAGSVVTITASPIGASTMTSWTGCDSASGLTCTVSLNTDRTVSVQFDSTSSDAAEWVSLGPVMSGVMALAFHPQNPVIAYAAIPNDGIYKSTDGGDSWSRISSDPSAPSQARTLVIDPASPTTLYIGAYGSGVFKSVDGGYNWIAVNSGLVGDMDLAKVVLELAIDPLNPSIIYAGTAAGVFKSTDAGESWLGILNEYRGPWVHSMKLDPSAPMILYISTPENGVRKSIDGGTTWFSASDGLPPSTAYPVLSIDPHNTSTIYAATSYGLYKTVNGGTNWQQIANSQLYGVNSSSVTMNSVIVDPANAEHVYLGSYNYGIYRSIDGGTNWLPMNRGMRLGDINTFAYNSGVSPVLYVGSMGSGVYKNIPIIGSSAVSLSSTSIDLGVTATYGASQTQFVTLNNSGSYYLVVNSSKIVGSSSASFTHQAGTCLSTTPTIPPGKSCTIGVNFSPSTVGTKTAALEIASNDPVSPIVTVSLSGIAYDPPPFGTIAINSGAVQTNSTYVTLTPNAIDNSGQVADMRFSNNNSTWTNWEVYGTSKAWMLLQFGGDGQKTVYVQFRDAAGNASGSFFSSIILDTTPPTITITSMPNSLYTSGSGGFSFTANEAVSGFQCRIDSGAFASCTSPSAFTGLADGAHSFTIQTTDLAGNWSGTIWNWTIDTTPPDSTITAKPSNPTNQTGGSFSFTASETGSIFQCSLDSAAWSSCTTPFTFSTLADGSHTFRVRSTDPAGNLGQPASYSWTVNTSTVQNVKIQNLGSYFATLGEAFGAFTSGTPALVLGRAMDYTENLILDRCGEIVTLEGGYAPDFSVRTGQSRVIGSLVIICGTLVADGITIQ